MLTIEGIPKDEILTGLGYEIKNDLLFYKDKLAVSYTGYTEIKPSEVLAVVPAKEEKALALIVDATEWEQYEDDSK